eukprot:4537282-Prymnesium_polylepis.1
MERIGARCNSSVTSSRKGLDTKSYRARCPSSNGLRRQPQSWGWIALCNRTSRHWHCASGKSRALLC